MYHGTIWNKITCNQNVNNACPFSESIMHVDGPPTTSFCWYAAFLMVCKRSWKPNLVMFASLDQRILYSGSHSVMLLMPRRFGMGHVISGIRLGSMNMQVPCANSLRYLPQFLYFYSCSLLVPLQPFSSTQKNFKFFPLFFSCRFIVTSLQKATWNILLT